MTKLELCRQCNGTEEYDDGVEYGLVPCDRCFYGFEPDQGECPKQVYEIAELVEKECETSIETLDKKGNYEGSNEIQILQHKLIKQVCLMVMKNE